MLKKVAGAIALVVLATACTPQHNESHAQAHHDHPHYAMGTYREHASTPDNASGSSNDWVYWYLLYADSGSSSSSTSSNSTTTRTPAYYYRSTTPVTNFTSAQFTPVKGGVLPKDVKEEVEKSEEVGEKEMTETEEPANVAQAEAQGAAQEASQESASVDGSVGANSGGSTSGGRSSPEESESNDSSSESSSDSGSSGGDSGGGGGDGGGGGE